MRAYKTLSIVGLILLFFLFTIESGFYSSKKRIPFSQIENIDWNLFKRLPDIFEGYSARISTSIDYKIKNDSIYVTSYMYPFRSYVIHPELLTNRVLKHEKYHFMITELLARKFKDEVSLQKRPFDKDKIKEIYKKINTDVNQLQKVFDLDTNHGQGTLIQNIWYQVIDTLLRFTDLPQSYFKSTSVKDNSFFPIKPTISFLYKTIMTSDSIRLQLTYFSNGNIKSEVIYKSEKPDGYYYDWFENGTINHTVLYKNGSRNGLSVTFNSVGDTIETYKYQNNILID